MLAAGCAAGILLLRHCKHAAADRRRPLVPLLVLVLVERRARTREAMMMLG
jgi:hypothetical protein